MSFPPLWLMGIDPETLWEFDGFLLGTKTSACSTAGDCRREYELQESTHSLISDDVLLPDGFPAPQLVLPDSGFAPDFFTFSGYWFCSHRLRKALAQREQVVQFAPVEIVAAANKCARRSINYCVCSPARKRWTWIARNANSKTGSTV